VIFRSILKNKLFSFIHIFGLAMGLACAFMLFMVIRTELAFDQFHENKERIYILKKSIFFETGTYTTERTGDAYGPKMIAVYPEIEKATRFKNPGELLFNTETKDGRILAFLEDNGAAVDSSFLEILTFPLVSGSSKEALLTKNSIVITEKMANKLFSSVDVVGKEIRINDAFTFVVNAVIEDVPTNSFLQFDYLISYEFLPELGYDLQYFEGTRTNNIFLLHEGASPVRINEVINDQKLDWYEPDIETDASLYPFSKIHLYGESQNINALIVFFIVGVLILIIASINYTNLSTARFAGRTKEVGIRKTLGADRGMLFWQFIGEALFNSFIAMDLALLLTEVSLPYLNSYYETELATSFNQPSTWITILGLILFTGFLSGFYPSMIMSKFQAVNVLKNQFMQGFKGFRLRKILVSVQFSLAVAFIITSIFLVIQFNHLKSSDSGFRKENIIYMQTKGLMWENYDGFKDALMNIPGIEKVSSTSSVPAEIGLGEFEWGLTDEHQTSLAMVCWADETFPELFEIEMLDGSFYQNQSEQECENGIVINKRMQDFLQLEYPIGETFYLYHHRYQIIGVVDDFNFFPFKLIDQLLIMPYSSVHDYIFIGYNTSDSKALVDEIEAVYKQYNPAFPFECEFFSEYVIPMDRAFNNSKPFLMFFTFLSVFISLLGLFGLTAFTTAQKVKEIGIHKAFGATMMQIVSKISFQFAKPIIITDSNFRTHFLYCF